MKQNKWLTMMLAVVMAMVFMPATTVFVQAQDTVVEKIVSNENELENALNGADNNVVITVKNDIELSKGIKVSGNRNIVLQGAANDVTITFADTVDVLNVETDHSMFYFQDNATVSMTVQHIILDGAAKARLFYVGVSDANAPNQLILESGATLQNGYPQLASGETGNNPSGGAVRLMLNTKFVMNDGRIINNQSDRYGGGVFAWSNGVHVEINGGEISGNIGNYAGGIVLLGNTQFYLYGGKIFNNVGRSHGKGIFYQDGTMHIGGSTVVQDDVYFNNAGKGVFIDSALTGEILFKNPNTISASPNYTITDSDVMHLRTQTQDKAFYLNKDNNTVELTDARTVTFHSNIENDADSVVQKVPSGYQAMLFANPFVRDGYGFQGWNTSPDGSGTNYQDQALITTSTDLELYAQWKLKSDQVLSFADSELTKHMGNGVFTNTLTQTIGTGTITYFSSDPNVAIVDVSTGEVTIVGAGTTTISAIAEENNDYHQATISYTLTVSDHDFGEWKNDESNHWQECMICGEKGNVSKHTYTWIIDKEATESESGLKHEECTICGHKKTFVTIPATDGEQDEVTITDNDSGVSVSGKFPSDVNLFVEVLKEQPISEIIKLIQDPAFVKTYRLEKVYDIYMYQNGTLYQPHETFQIRIKLPEYLRNQNVKVVYISDDGEITEIASTIRDGYISFHTDHNSYYALVTKKATSNPITDTATNANANGLATVIVIGAFLFLYKKIEKEVKC